MATHTLAAAEPRPAASSNRRPLAAVGLHKDNVPAKTYQHSDQPRRSGKELHAAAVGFGETPPTAPEAVGDCISVLCELQECHAQVYRGRLDIATLGARVVARSYSAGAFAGASAIGAAILSAIVPRALGAVPGSCWWALIGSVSAGDPATGQLSSAEAAGLLQLAGTVTASSIVAQPTFDSAPAATAALADLLILDASRSATGAAVDAAATRIASAFGAVMAMHRHQRRPLQTLDAVIGVLEQMSVPSLRLLMQQLCGTGAPPVGQPAPLTCQVGRQLVRLLNEPVAVATSALRSRQEEAAAASAEAREPWRLLRGRPTSIQEAAVLLKRAPVWSTALPCDVRALLAHATSVAARPELLLDHTEHDTNAAAAAGAVEALAAVRRAIASVRVLLGMPAVDLALHVAAAATPPDDPMWIPSAMASSVCETLRSLQPSLLSLSSTAFAHGALDLSVAALTLARLARFDPADGGEEDLDILLAVLSASLFLQGGDADGAVTAVNGSDPRGHHANAAALEWVLACVELLHAAEAGEDVATADIEAVGGELRSALRPWDRDAEGDRNQLTPADAAPPAAAARLRASVARAMRVAHAAVLQRLLPPAASPETQGGTVTRSLTWLPIIAREAQRALGPFARQSLNGMQMTFDVPLLVTACAVQSMLCTAPAGELVEARQLACNALCFAVCDARVAMPLPLVAAASATVAAALAMSKRVPPCDNASAADLAAALTALARVWFAGDIPVQALLRPTLGLCVLGAAAGHVGDAETREPMRPWMRVSQRMQQHPPGPTSGPPRPSAAPRGGDAAVAEQPRWFADDDASALRAAALRRRQRQCASRQRDGLCAVLSHGLHTARQLRLHTAECRLVGAPIAGAAESLRRGGVEVLPWLRPDLVVVSIALTPDARFLLLERHGAHASDSGFEVVPMAAAASQSHSGAGWSSSSSRNAAGDVLRELSAALLDSHDQIAADSAMLRIESAGSVDSCYTDGGGGGGGGGATTSGAETFRKGTRSEKERWWASRRAIDARVRAVVDAMDGDLLGPLGAALVVGAPLDAAAKAALVVLHRSARRRVAEWLGSLAPETARAAVPADVSAQVLDADDDESAWAQRLGQILNATPTTPDVALATSMAPLEAPAVYDGLSAALGLDEAALPAAALASFSDLCSGVARTALDAALRSMVHDPADMGDGEGTSVLARQLSSSSARADRLRRNVPRQHVLLCVEGPLARLPWELTHALDGQRVSRVPGTDYVKRVLGVPPKQRQPQQQHIDGVQRTRGAFLTNLRGDMAKTAQRLRPVIEADLHWRGAASPAEARALMPPGTPRAAERFLRPSHDVFLFADHGDTSDVIPAAELDSMASQHARSPDGWAWRPAALLMGCNSACRAEPRAEAAHPVGVMSRYLLAGCSMAVGCLWEVTDGDVDRVTVKALEAFYGEGLRWAPAYHYSSSERLGTTGAAATAAAADGHGGNATHDAERLSGRMCHLRVSGVRHEDPEQRPCSSPRLREPSSVTLFDAFSHARSAARLRHFTGGAVVAYGVPSVMHQRGWE